jgi:hypothetical protein
MAGSVDQFEIAGDTRRAEGTRRRIRRELRPCERRRRIIGPPLSALLSQLALTHALHFSGDFLCQDDPESIGPSERPISLYQANVSIEKETWRNLARHVFRVAPDRLTADAELRKAVETDTCDNPVSPVEVWIDPGGYYTVLLHDATMEGG